MEKYVAEIKIWMTNSYMLKLNDDKTELFVFDDFKGLNLNINIGNASVQASSKFRNLGVTLGSRSNNVNTVSCEL